MSRALRRARLRAIDVLRPVLPARMRRALRETERALDPGLVWLYRRRTGERRPIPPRAIRERNAVNYVGQWFDSGAGATRPLLALIERAGVNFDDLERVLDFGCGGGKVLAELRGRGPELFGCDIHGPSIAWLGRTFTDLHVQHTAFDPPLPYPDAHFDLLWAWSVLTHLDADGQEAWLAEWARVLRPGGTLLVTFLGPSSGRGELTDADRERLASLGTVFCRYQLDGNYSADFAGTTRPYGVTFNSPERMRDLVGAHFEVVELVPAAVWEQDCVIARRDGR
jgi:SAM-dependent methyltransferase